MRDMFNKIFFTQIPRRDVGLFRILFCLTLLAAHVLFLPFHLSFYTASISQGISLPLIQLAGVFQKECVLVLALLIILGLLFAAIGLHTRIALLLTTVMFFIFYKPVLNILSLHHAQLPFFTLLILSLSPGVTSLSYFKQSKTVRGYVDSWPLQLPIVLLGLSYFATGFWKIVDGGIQQFNGEVLQYYLAFYGMIRGIELSLFLSGLPLWVLGLLSTAVIIFQITFLLVFLFPGVKRYYIIAGILFHTAIFVLFHIGDFPLFYASVYLATLHYNTAARFFAHIRNKMHQPIRTCS